MLRKSIIAAVILGALLLLAPHSASAQVRFGVTVGSPGYYNYYPGYYPYTYPVYSGPTYVYPSYVYRYPAYSSYYVAPRHVYRYKYKRHHHDDWDRHYRRR